ncbi:MAG: alpha-amylase family glycosyl hydrolase [Gemmataceae bacterium]
MASTVPPGPRYPALYQINTRVWLTALGRTLGRAATLDDIPDSELDEIARAGFDWVWLLSVWQTGPTSQRVSRTHPGWRHEFETTLPDLREEDIGGSGFAITDYRVDKALGGDPALARLRQRLAQRGLLLLLDFVPNHLGLDHPWLDQHPEYFITGTEDDLARPPQNFLRLQRASGERILAHGRDPYFDGWPDTVQLDYSRASTQLALRQELLRIAGQCDGLRCDMAMLVLPEVFARTWGRPALPFWPEAIRQVRDQVPGFVFLAEVYWDLEWAMLQEGFDFAYDKRLYDRLREGHARPIREHLRAGLDYQDHLARFLENHDEARAAAAFPQAMHPAAAVITYLSPGLRFFQQGQREGRTCRISPHLVRGPDEPRNEALWQFYSRLETILRFPTLRSGTWQLLDASPAWDGNPTHDDCLVFAWSGPEPSRLVVAVNYAGYASQCHVQLPFAGLGGRTWRLRDLLGAGTYDWQGDDLVGRGLYLDLAPWQACVFLVE